MSKNIVNPFVQSLKAQMVIRFPELQDGIDVNPRSAWVRGNIPASVQKSLKDAGFVACTKGYFFTHDCVKMPKFAPVAKQAKTVKPVAKQAPAKPATAKPAQVKTAKAEKPKKEWVKLPLEVVYQIIRKFSNAYPGCIVEVRGTYVVLIGLVFKTNEEYRNAIKADGFYFVKKELVWKRALREDEIAQAQSAKAEKPENSGAEKAPEQPKTEPTYVNEIADLSEVIIKARKGEITREQMIAMMKEVCPF